jgi:hypothetical protein
MSTPYIIFNILIPQGSTFETTFIFKNSLSLTKDVVGSVASPVMTIEVAPLPQDLPVGYELVFSPNSASCDTVSLIVDAPATQGDLSVVVQPFVGNLACKLIAKLDAIDQTTNTWFGSIRETAESPTTLADFTVTTPNNNSVLISLTDEETALIPANCRYDDIPTDLQNNRRFNSLVLRRAYFYDLDARM